jgi:predicted Co/Zn/Cd cation transporter (cation efflux family)
MRIAREAIPRGFSRVVVIRDEISTSVSADGGDTAVTCTITMDGNLVSYQAEPRPTCSFAYFS